MMPHTTLVHLFLERIASSGDVPAIWTADEGEFRSRTWRELADDVFSAAAVLSASVAPGEPVVQLSENRYEWIVCDLAILLTQAVHVPIHAPLTADQVHAQMAHCGAKVAFASTTAQVDKIIARAKDLPTDLRLVSFEPDERAEPFSRWLDRSVEDPQPLIEAARANLNAESIATLLYTSGTTGNPKGVILTQGNLTSNTRGILHALPQSSQDLRVNFLPLSHIFARTCDLYTWIALGSQLGLAQSRESVIADCQTLRPTTLNGVPYFFDKVRRALEAMGTAAQPAAVQTLFGGRLKYFCSGGAALPDHLFDYFLAQNVPILQGYGLTETSPVISVSSLEHVRRGASGKPIQDVEIRIAADDEILTRGPHVMPGYYLDPAATSEVIRDGWFYTGDYGHLDDDGFLFIRGRKKEVIVTTGGKNIAPVYLESLLTEDPLMAQAMVIGDDRNYLTALIVPNLDGLRDFLAENAWPTDSPPPLEDPQIRAIFEQRIRTQLGKVSEYEQVRRFTLLANEFTIDSGEMTPKLSLRRNVINQNYATQIEAMYGRPAPSNGQEG